ncbi:MAG: DUF3887 domain-containing protein [Anaerolineae bacterium]
MSRKGNFSRWLTAVCLTLVVGLAACSSGVQVLTGAEQDEVLAYAEPMTDNLLTGFNAGDYQVFARDFNAKMRDALNESAFGTTRAGIVEKIGAYVARNVSRVEKRGGFIIVIYSARFEQEDGVTVRVVFEPAGEHLVSGLWLDSPRLRQ